MKKKKREKMAPMEIQITDTKKYLLLYFETTPYFLKLLIIN